MSLKLLIPGIWNLLHSYQTCYCYITVKKEQSRYICNLESYRPISNLPFLGKIFEKVVYQQLHMYLSYNNFFDVYQSGFRVNHSTETALVRVVNDLKISSDNHKVIVLVFLDLSAAFDTVDRVILLKWLEYCLGLRGTVLNWLSSYLVGRSFSVVTV